MRADLKLVIGGESMGGSLYKKISIWEVAFTARTLSENGNSIGTLSYRLLITGS